MNRRDVENVKEIARWMRAHSQRRNQSMYAAGYRDAISRMEKAVDLLSKGNGATVQDIARQAVGR